MEKLDTGTKLILTVIGTGILIMLLGYLEFIRGGGFGLLLVVCGVIAFVAHRMTPRKVLGIREGTRILITSTPPSWTHSKENYAKSYEDWLNRFRQTMYNLGDIDPKVSIETAYLQGAHSLVINWSEAAFQELEKSGISWQIGRVPVINPYSAKS